jgi:hypothetical protein
MNGLVVGTIVARNYLAFARALNESLRHHHPDIPHYVLVADELGSGVGTRNESFRVLGLSDLCIDDLQSFLFGYERKPLLAALKPILLRHLLGAGYSSALYLDADMWVLDDLGPTRERITCHAMTLTPHLGMAPTRVDRQLLERLLLFAGMYNAGFVGVTDRPETHRFLAWWEARLRRHCDDDVRHGIHYDQRWLDLAPGFVEDLHILRDPGINVAYWNLPDVDARLDGGRLLVNGHTCRLFHFSGFDPDVPDRATRYLPELSVHDLGAAAPLFDRYRQRLKDAGHDLTKGAPWRWDHFANGVAITPKARRRYRALGDSARRHGDPFETRHKGSYYRSLTGPASHVRRVLRHLRRRKRKRSPGPDPIVPSTSR